MYVMKRRTFLAGCGRSLLLLPTWRLLADEMPESDLTTLFLCGDVMTGRGIDQVLPQPSDPQLHESWVIDANRYVDLAQSTNGPFPRQVPFEYPWGDALEELERVKPDARIINLETAITDSDDHWPAKGIHYRMHPANVRCITEAGIDCCVLANNHVLDWGYAGLEDTLRSLEDSGIGYAGAGRNAIEAEAPAILELPGKRRVLVFAYASPTAGVPRRWRATGKRSGVSYLPDLSRQAVRRIASQVKTVKQPGDIVVVSIHWGGNWGYAVPDSHRIFARSLIDEAEVDIIHGHSSHHPMGIEVHENRPILYGCGDFLNDYEGIGGHEEYRSDLTLMYLLTVEAGTGRLVRLEMVPFRIRQFRLSHASVDEAQWLATMMDRECATFGGGVAMAETKRPRLIMR